MAAAASAALSPTAATVTTTASATAAATASKHRPAKLPTPKSATYPSSLQSPRIPTPTYLNREESLKTPITPPSAYMDFLSKLSPAIKSPLSTSQSTTFSFTAPRSPAVSLYPPAPASARPAIPSRPSTSSVETSDSISSDSSASTTQSAPVANSSKPITRPDTVGDSNCSLRSSSTSAVPTSAPPRPGSMRRPSLMIPPSPTTNSPSLMSPASVSASGIKSPVSAGAAAKAYYTSASPVDAWSQALSAGVGQSRPVSVRHVITRTVTYTRGPDSATAGSPAVSTPAVSTPRSGRIDDQVKRVVEEALASKTVAEDESSPHKPGRAPLVGEAPRGKRRKLT